MYMANKVIKIILACEIFPPDIGGPATYATQLAEALVNSGHSVRVITYGEIKKQYPYPVTYISRRIPFFLRQFVYFFRLWIMSKHTDVIYAQGPSVGPAAIFLKRLRETHVVVKYVGDQSWQQVRMHGETIGFEEYMKSYGRVPYGWKIRLIQRWQKFSLQNADRIVVPSEYLKHVVVDYFGVVPEQVTVIPNGVGMNNGVLRHAQNDSRNILYIGRIENWKGLDTLIEALRLLPLEYTATIVGDGSEKKNLKLQVTSYKLQDRISFIGRIPHGELEQYFSNALCLYEGTQYEGMPHIVLESWSFGVPVVVSDFPANIELVKDGETGLVFKLGDASDLASKIQTLDSDRALWNQLSRAGFEEHKKYDKHKTMKQTLEYLSG